MGSGCVGESQRNESLFEKSGKNRINHFAQASRLRKIRSWTLKAHERLSFSRSLRSFFFQLVNQFFNGVMVYGIVEILRHKLPAVLHTLPHQVTEQMQH